MRSYVAAADNVLFSMVRSTAVVNAGCALNAQARVSINSLGPVEVMHVEASGLPPNSTWESGSARRRSRSQPGARTP